MDKKIQIRNSQAFILMIIILGFIVIGLAFSLLMKPVGDLYNQNHNKEILQEDVYQNFFTQSRTIWIWLPLITVFSLIIWAFAESHKRQGGYGG